MTSTLGGRVLGIRLDNHNQCAEISSVKTFRGLHIGWEGEGRSLTTHKAKETKRVTPAHMKASLLTVMNAGRGSPSILL